MSHDWALIVDVFVYNGYMLVLPVYDTPLLYALHLCSSCVFCILLVLVFFCYEGL
jgi:hypothetical protein